MTERLAIRLDEFLAHPPERVWAALTDSALLASWLMPNDFRPVAGHEFTFTTTPVPAGGFDGVIRCRVLDLDPPRRLRISWHGGPLESTVTWRLEPEGAGTRLFLDHEGFDPDDPRQVLGHKTMGSGWAGKVLPALARVLERSAGQAGSAARLIAASVTGMPVRAASIRLPISASASSPKRSRKNAMPSGRKSQDSVTSVPPSAGRNV